MNPSLRSPRILLGLLAFLTALACVFALSPANALADTQLQYSAVQTLGEVPLGVTTGNYDLQIYNTGTTAATLQSFSKTGPNAGDFQIDPSACDTVISDPNEGTPCNMFLVYTPSVLGPESVTLTFVYQDATAVFTISGTGITSVATATPVDFGQVTPGTTATQTVTVTSSSDDSPQGRDLTPITDGDFQLIPSPECSFFIDSCQMNVTFSPGASEDGPRSATLMFPMQTGLFSQNIPVHVSGIAAGPPVISTAWDGSFDGDFGDVTVTGHSTQRTLTVSNNGGQSLNLGAADLSGTDAGQFEVSGDTCSNTTVAPGATCTIAVRFSPTAPGSQTAELDIPSDAAGSPTAIDLSGRGAAAPTVSSTGGSTTTTTTPTLTATAQPGSTVTFIVDGKTVGTATANSDGRATFTLTTPLSDGPHIVKVITTDPAGDPSTASAAYTLTVTTTTTTGATGQPGSGSTGTTAQPGPVSTPHPTPQPKPVERMTRVGHPKSTQKLLAHGEKVRVYCNQACSLKVNLKVYHRAAHRGARYEQLLRNAHSVRTPQDWWRVTVGQKRVALNHAGYKTITVRVNRVHRTVVADAGGILLGVYTHHNGQLVRSRWLHVHGPDMPAKVRQLRARTRQS